MNWVRNQCLWWWVGALLLANVGSSLAAEQKASFELFADRTAWVPGETMSVGIRFTIAEKWHIYWRNSGDSGYPTTFDWTLPEGFKVDDVQFPMPQREVFGELTTFVLYRQPIFLADVHVPESTKVGETLTLELSSRWLVCSESQCVPEDGIVELTLPVAASTEEAESANEIDFRMARNWIPLPAKDALHLDSLTTIANVDKIKPGESFKVAVVLDLAEWKHIYAHDPLIEGFINTDVFPDAVKGLFIDPVEFPAGHRELLDGLDKTVAVYRDKVEMVIPISAANKIEASELTISGVVKYQACDDKTKLCARETSAEWSVTLPVAQADEEPNPTHTTLFDEHETADAQQDQITTMASDDASLTWIGRTQKSLKAMGVVGWLIMALMGGFILNLMPCVLPVISIKVLSFVKQAKESRGRVFLLGLSFAAGIEVSFLILGGLILGLNQQWGGLFQNYKVVIGLAAVVMAFALSLFGVFAIFPPKIVNEIGGHVQEEEGPLGAFGMGLLATLLGTACTAPFLSVVLAIALQQSRFMGFLIFATAGLGMALPYVLLAANPVWIKFIPKPGAWMKTFEQIMGFLLLGTVVWLLKPLPAQIGGEGLYWTLAFLVCVAMAVWLYGRVEYGAPLRKKLTHYALALLLIAGGGYYSFAQAPPSQIPWRSYSRAAAKQAVEEGHTIFIDYTAEWCVNCKTYERLVIETDAVASKIAELNVIPFKADYTNFDVEIEEDLERFDRPGVPMYVVVPAGQWENAILLDDFLTLSAVLDGLDQAGPSKAKLVAEESAMLDEGDVEKQ